MEKKIAALEKQIAGQHALLADKSLVNNLPDKGKRIEENLAAMEEKLCQLKLGTMSIDTQKEKKEPDEPIAHHSAATDLLDGTECDASERPAQKTEEEMREVIKRLPTTLPDTEKAIRKAFAWSSEAEQKRRLAGRMIKVLSPEEAREVAKRNREHARKQQLMKLQTELESERQAQEELRAAQRLYEEGEAPEMEIVME
eukprot:TRINITY_DN45692_c0_g1_i1.p2 TRINITY_DN45692_c0_g1~~TRINITY_DN45692_c0_g1_i1.p2  ORF type:complete len:210 (-),score=27.15 TRINITY_DN45692_c0_g1_i1:1097-1693(-)